MVAPREELLDLLKLDYDQASEFIRGVLGTALAIRGWAITVTLAFAGLSVNQNNPRLGALGVATAVVFCVVDLYHFALYRQALRHVQSLERLYADYYSGLSRVKFDNHALHEFLIDLETHKFGFYRWLEPFSVKEVRHAIPIVAIYVLLVMASGATVAF